MLTIHDRQLILSYFKAYLFCLVSLLGLFVIVDLFMHIEDFTSTHKDFESLVKFVGVYYGNKSFEIFDRLCEALGLMAGMFTVAWMQRNNELLPLLSAGVSTRRAVRPVILCAFLMMGLVAANQELALPHIDAFMLQNRQNPHGARESVVQGAFDTTTKIHLTGRVAIKKDRVVKDAQISIPSAIGRQLTILYVKEAQYMPEDGGWVLRQTTPGELPNWPTEQEHILKPRGPGEYFLKTNVDLDTVTRVKNWYLYLPTWKLLQELDRTENAQHAYIAMNFHSRLTRPLVGVILVLMGLSVILRDQNRNVFISAGLCLLLCGIFFATLFACQHLGLAFLPPALAAWVPVFVFGPLSLVMYAEVHT